SFLELSDTDFQYKLTTSAKYKLRSHTTHHTIHVPELTPNLLNTSKITTLYLGNSMLERLKTTGKNTELAKLPSAWNAGCGGDKNENVVWRLAEGLYEFLRKNCDGKGEGHGIKAVVLVSGTNNLRPCKPFRAQDITSYRLLLEACLRLAPKGCIVACDMFRRKDVRDVIVEECNGILKRVVEEVNKDLRDAGEEERVKWVEARETIGTDMLDDHVHLNEEGYAAWDRVL
ncbi:uncharacterized protein BDR25DRAFT_154944, partial [Lindgomyces ingoldianus]